LTDYTHGQESWVKDLFSSQLDSGYKGFFIEAGASDGHFGSNTLFLERDYGWGGVLIEPNKKFFESLKRNRNGLCINAILSNKDGVTAFVQAGWYGAAPELVKHIWGDNFPDENENYRKDYDGTDAEKVVLPARTVSSLLTEFDYPKIVDYFSLDVEGAELSVLQGIDFNTHIFRVICLETKYSNGATTVDHIHRAPCRKLLEKNNYIHVHELEWDDCFIHHSEVELIKRSRA
jgi:FkbM family methyltransferase